MVDLWKNISTMDNCFGIREAYQHDFDPFVWPFTFFQSYRFHNFLLEVSVAFLSSVTKGINSYSLL